MSLIDPTTPEGFFHLRLVPYKLRLLDEGRSLFPRGPEPGRESYFEDPTAGADVAGVDSDPALLTAAGTLAKLRAGWASRGESLLLSLTEPLEGLRERLALREPEEEEKSLSDFVYPLF